MHDYFSDLLQWMWLVISGWRQYAEAGVTGLTWIIVERIRKQPLSWRVLAYIAIAFLFFAFFNTWRDQKQKVQALTNQNKALQSELEKEKDRSKPKLFAELSQIAVAPNGADSILTILGSIKNDPTGAPSIADDIRIYVNIPGHEEAEGELIPPPSGSLTLGYEGGSVKLLTEDFLPRKTVRAPIPAGGAAFGWLSVRVRALTREQIMSNGTVIRMTFKDIRGNLGTVEKVESGNLYTPPDFSQSKAKPTNR